MLHGDVVPGAFYEYQGSQPEYKGKPVQVLLPKRNICQPLYADKGATHQYVSHKDCFYGEFEDGTGWDMMSLAFGPRVDPPTPPIYFDLKEALLCDS